MAAIITTPFRVLNAENFKEDIASAGTSVYLGIGKSDVWSDATSDLTDTIPFTPGDHLNDRNDAWSQMQALKLISAGDVAHVVPRHDYADGQTYEAWDSKDGDIFDDKFYVITSEFKVYKCIQKGSGNTATQPTHTDATIKPTRAQAAAGDGYRWKYMYTVTTADSEKFLTKSFMPVKTLAESPTLATTNVNYPQQQSQVASRALSTAAGIERIVVTNGGQNYSSADTFVVTIEGDGSGASVTDADVTVTGGAITDIAINAEGTDYTKATVTITHGNESSGTAGTGATARAVISPSGGHGTDPVSELGAFFIAINTQLDNSSDEDFTAGNDFRQITLVKNPYSTGTTVATAETLKATKYLQLANGQTTSGFVVDQVIQGSVSNAKAYLVEIDSTNRRLHYYQNEKTGFKAFQGGGSPDTVTGTLPSGGSGVLASSHLGAAEVVAGSGQLIFLENRDPISRTASQIEDIKCIIEF